MKPISISLLTICGLDELEKHRSSGVTHVLSILDPQCPDPSAFMAYDRHHRTILHFHDAIEPAPGVELPRVEHVEAVLNFGRRLAEDAVTCSGGHLLVHCHMGISRSTAAMATLLAQLQPEESEECILKRLLEVRPQAWPNSRLISFADELLGRSGRFTAALSKLYALQLTKRPGIADVMQRNGRGREVEMAHNAC